MPNRIRFFRKEKKMTMKQLGECLGVAESTISQYETGKRQPDNETLIRLAEFFGVTVDNLLGRSDEPYMNPMSPENSIRGITDPDEIQRRISSEAHFHAVEWARKYPNAPASTGGVWIPVLGRVAAGIPIEALENIEDYEEISMDMAMRGEHFALRISGDSMEPRILDGDVVIVKRQDVCNTGDIAVVLVNGSDATVKRIKKEPEGLILIPNNAAYEPMFYSNEQIESLPVRVLGKVVELRRKL